MSFIRIAQRITSKFTTRSHQAVFDLILFYDVQSAKVQQMNREWFKCFFKPNETTVRC